MATSFNRLRAEVQRCYINPGHILHKLLFGARSSQEKQFSHGFFQSPIWGFVDICQNQEKLGNMKQGPETSGNSQQKLLYS